MNHPNYRNGFHLTVHEHLLRIPLEWKQPRVIFVDSMSDLFHEHVPLDFILRVFEVMTKATQHHFQILTKRSSRLSEISHILPWPRNIWMGVSIENNDYVTRADDLRETPARIKFLSLEPLLGPLSKLDLKGTDWVIVGGESGPRARPMQKGWVLEIHDKCKAAGVPFFFKQWGGVNKKKSGRMLEGRTWDQMPQRVQITQSRT